jgi:hypothetical protein
MSRSAGAALSAGELAEDVAVDVQGQRGRVAALVGHLDDGAALGDQEQRERVPQVVGAHRVEARARDRFGSSGRRCCSTGLRGGREGRQARQPPAGRPRSSSLAGPRRAGEQVDRAGAPFFVVFVTPSASAFSTRIVRSPTSAQVSASASPERRPA